MLASSLLRVPCQHEGWSEALETCAQVADECKQKGSAEAKAYSLDLSSSESTIELGKKLQVLQQE
jgi:hypothetical protein